MVQKLLRALRRPCWLALLGGLALCTPWVLHAVWTVPFVLLPWFALFDALASRRTSCWRSMLWCYLSAVVWNALSVWWIAGATFGGMLGAVLAMAACMTLILLLTLYAWRAGGRRMGLLTFGVAWVAFEYFSTTPKLPGHG